jgi:catechol 2,3-dioxygenase-like lactoylglutathione lyase family enzyme
MIIDHIGITVGDFANSKLFYRRALAPLGIEMLVEGDDGAGFGKGTKPEFWLDGAPKKHSPMHIAFVAQSRAKVGAFHAAAIAAGGVDNGAPGLRTQYHPNYFGAFVIDPDGHNIEAVCHRPEI